MADARWKVALFVTLIVYLLPILLTIFDRYAIDYSIGPMVLLYSLAVLLLSIPLYAWWLSGRFSGALSAVASIGLSILSATLVLNWFMLLTNVFGVADYDPM